MPEADRGVTPNVAAPGLSPHPCRGHTIWETRSCWGVWGERLRSRPRFVVWGPGPKQPAVAEAVAGTEPERSGGGVRLMLNRVN
jgi:hypothetical protein